MPHVTGAAAGRRLARAEITTTRTGISTVADITGLSIGPADGLTVTDRPVEIRAFFPLIQQVTSAGQPTLFITRTDNVELGRAVVPTLAAAAYGGGVYVVSYELAAGTGNITVKARATTSAGTLSILASADFRPFIAAYVN